LGQIGLGHEHLIDHVLAFLEEAEYAGAISGERLTQRQELFLRRLFARERERVGFVRDQDQEPAQLLAARDGRVAEAVLAAAVCERTFCSSVSFASSRPRRAACT